MSLRRFLLIPLVISVGIFAYYSSAVDTSFRTLQNTVHVSYELIFILILAALLQIAGHIVRAYKARLLLGPVKESSARFQFRALSIGYLFDAILPFKLGELIRARIISAGLIISFSFALVLIIFERALDAFILGAFGLIIVPVFIGTDHTKLLTYVGGLALLALIVFICAALTIKEDNHILKAWFRFTGVLNTTLKNSFRFKGWSVIYGLQQTLRPRQLVRYIGLSFISWILYASSVLVIAQYFLPYASASQKTILSISPYYGVAVPAGPANLGVFSRITNAFTSFIHLSTNDALVFNLVVWAELIMPIALLGVILLFVKTKESLWQKRPKQASQQSLLNKLHRAEDISSEMAGFLESYFSGNSLSKIVHRLERRNDFRLMKYFKGGSDAITILVSQNGEEIVKKIIPLEFKDRLKAQHDWLVAYGGKEGIVKVIREEKAPDFYAIDLEYHSDDMMFFDFMHRSTYAKSTAVLDEVWGRLFKTVYDKPGKLASHEAERDAYIKKHILGCLEKAAAAHEELLQAAALEKILINGKEYDNLYAVLEKIKAHPKAWQDIATYRETKTVHGDVAIDNILVSSDTGKARLIDPAPDGNIINGPVFDFGKNMQSLYCGYEFLLRDDDPVYLTEGAINYRDHSSAQYTQLCNYVRTELAPRSLSKAEQRALLFHAGALHIRRLKHQVYHNPANTLKFYAVGVKTLNDFLAQYE